MLKTEKVHASVLQLSSGAVNITGAGTLQYAGTAITATAAEINTLDGFTGDVNDFNYLKDLETLHATGVTATEFDYLDGVTSNIQTQLDSATGFRPVDCKMEDNDFRCIRNIKLLQRKLKYNYYQNLLVL